VKLCAGCNEPLTGPGRSDRRYCDSRCRKQAFLRRQAEAQAPELTQPELDRSGTATTAPSLDREALEQALQQALAEPRLVAYLAHAARSNWRAAAWLLERRYPERWGAGEREPEPLVPGEADPFREVDQLAERRRLHLAHD
jgi:hypothetical protein